MLAWVIAIVFGLSACGGGTEGAAEGDATASSDAAAEDGADASAAEPVTVKIGIIAADDSAFGIELHDYFKPELEKRSNGRFSVEVYTNGVLGGDRQMYEALQIGTLEICLGTLSTLSNFDPIFGVTDLPYLYKDRETAIAAFNGAWGDSLKENLPNMGMRLLSYSENAFRNISNDTKPIEKLSDIKGMKIRVMESPVFISTFKAFGASPTPIAYSELYTALQNGTVDGQDNGINITYLSKYYEVQKYYTLTEHAYAACAFVASENFWKNLDPELQTILEEVCKDCSDTIRVRNQSDEERYIKLMEEEGMQINYLSPEAKEEFREAAMSVWDELAETYGSEIMDAAKSINETYGN
jgi:tripartite ATP-independent transporter DctP family solute receptor